MRARKKGSVALIASVALAAVALGGPARARPIGDTRVFAAVPSPGQPAGIAVGAGMVWTSTMGMVTRPASDPSVFGFHDATGELRSTIAMARAMPAMAMALFGMAFDAAERLYVVDMNGMIFRIDPVTGASEMYTEFPAAVGGLTTMPMDIAFDNAGNAYVTDANLGAIWRVPPGGERPEIWFRDPRLAGYLLGPAGIRLDPGGTHLYVAVASSLHPTTPRQGLIFRLPLDDPTPASLERVFAYPAGASPCGIAFGASGRLYVALSASHQVSVLGPSGAEMLRFPSPTDNARRDVPYDRPYGVALDGKGSLLVTNTAFLSGEERMVVLEAFVDDTAAPLVRPPIP